MKNIILTSSFPPAYPVIYDRHRWFFAIVFCHPPSFFLSTLSSGFLFFFIQTVRFHVYYLPARMLKQLFSMQLYMYAYYTKIFGLFLDTPLPYASTWTPADVFTMKAWVGLCPVSILGFENCQSFFSYMYIRCAAMRGAPHITYRKLFNKHTILSCLFLKMVVYCNKQLCK